MKKIIIASLIIISIFVINVSVTTYKTEKIITEKKEVWKIEKNPTIRVPDSYLRKDILIRMNDENRETIKGAEFELQDLYGNNLEDNTIKPEEYVEGQITFETKKANHLDFLKFLSKTEENKIETVETIEQVKEIFDQYVCDENSCTIQRVIPIVLDEVVTPKGYAKEKYILMAFAEYKMDKNANAKLYLSTLNIDIDTNIYFDYDKNTNYETFHEDVLAGKYNDIAKSACETQPTNLSEQLKTIKDSEIKTIGGCNFFIKNDVANPSLKIENIINNSLPITGADKTINSKVVVENTGNVPLTNNIIKVSLDKKLEYVEKSASNNGEYNKEKHEITWNIEEIESDEIIELTYQVKTPSDAKSNDTYINETTINNNETEEQVVKSTAKVTPLNNPSTGIPYFISLSLL